MPLLSSKLSLAFNANATPAAPHSDRGVTEALSVNDLAQRILHSVTNDILHYRTAAIVLPGGKTPQPLFAELAQQAQHIDSCDWSQLSVIMSDERRVDLTSTDSNLGNVLRAWHNTPLAHAKTINLADDVNAETSLSEQRWPLSAVVVGMGTDGHVASLFPGNTDPVATSINKTSYTITTVAQGTPCVERVSLSLHALTNAGLTAVLISGEEKRRVFDRYQYDLTMPVGRLWHFAHQPLLTDIQR